MVPAPDNAANHLALAEACRWIGAPYRHQASAPQLGCDCLGLLRGIWRALYGAEPIPVPPYTPDWSEPSGDETLRRALSRLLIKRPNPAAAQPGDVLLFAMRRSGPAKHLGLLTDCGTMIHAVSGRGVSESPYGPAWKARAVAAFGWPELDQRQPL